MLIIVFCVFKPSFERKVTIGTKKIIEKEFDYVGDKFTDEAKKIKYGEAKDRAIYGEASIEQTKELIDEDIDVLPLPFSTKKTN